MEKVVEKEQTRVSILKRNMNTYLGPNHRLEGNSPYEKMKNLLRGTKGVKAADREELNSV